jgi:drug/metabolite transporter (DMT)-like permease
LIFILLGAIWSSSFMWIKIAVQEIGPVTLVAFRALFGLLFGVVVIFIGRVGWPRTFKAWGPLLLLGVTNIAIPFFLISWGEQSIDSALIAHYLLDDDKITWPKMLGLLIGFAGVVVLMSKDIFNASTSSLLGQAAVILASIFYAVNSVYIRKTTGDIPGIVRSTGPLLSASAVMWLSTLLFESPVQLPQLGITWIALLWLGIFGSGLAFLMAYYLIHEIGPTRTTMVTYLFPLGGVLLGVTFLNEQLTWQLITGAILIVLSLVVANWQPREQKMQERQRVTSS